MSSSIPVDLELKKAFAELQQKMIDTRNKLKISDNQVEGLKRNILHRQITDKEMSALPVETKVYQGVGRCFFASTIPQVRENIGKTVKELQDKIKVYEQSKEFLERDIKGSENSLRELILQKKNAQ